MLKPKYVHGVNADEAPRSVLNRLQNDGQKFWPWDDVPPPPPGDDADQLPGTQWTWTLG
jgi:hypothetical protein